MSVVSTICLLIIVALRCFPASAGIDSNGVASTAHGRAASKAFGWVAKLFLSCAALTLSYILARAEIHLAITLCINRNLALWVERKFTLRFQSIADIDIQYICGVAGTASCAAASRGRRDAPVTALLAALSADHTHGLSLCDGAAAIGLFRPDASLLASDAVRLAWLETIPANLAKRG
jgi:hypothetical protein